MAKRKEAPQAESPVELASPTATAGESVPSPPRRWLVELDAATPLAQRSMIIEAENETAAKAVFCEANGITGSACQWSVVEQS